VGGERTSVTVPIVRLPSARGLPLPSYATEGSSGLDLPAAVEGDLTLEAGARVAVPTGLQLALPAGFEGQVRGRSGLALRAGIVLPNAPGTIDSDYRGEIHVILWNTGAQPFVVRRGDRIAQLVIAPVARARLAERTALDETERGGGGFGHTGRRSGASGPGERGGAG
jgi:dUTP pyrophosphatase